MAAKSVNLVPSFLLIFLIVQGARSQEVCKTDRSVYVEQVGTTETVGSDRVVQVTVKNICDGCAVRGVVLSAVGFSSSMPVDPALFRREAGGDDDYLVANGARIEKGEEVKFRYASNHSWVMDAVAVQDTC